LKILKIILRRILKILKAFLLSIIFISFFPASSFAQFVFTPFKNSSNYDGAWKLETEVPNFVAAYLREIKNSRVFSSTAFLSIADERNISGRNLNDIEILGNTAQDLGYEYVVMGDIKTFSIQRFTAGDPLTAGYESYTCEITVAFQVFNSASHTQTYAGAVTADVKSSGLGITIFGKPTDQKRQFYILNELRFGGEEFSETIVGSAMIQLCEKFAEDLERSVKNIFITKDEIIPFTADKTLDDLSLESVIKKGKLLTYDAETGEAFINLGSQDVNPGEKLSVYSPADSLFDPSTGEFLGLSETKVSILEIIELRGEKLSLAIIQENREKVEAGMEVRKIILKRRK
jgi:hypothetical protein